MNAEFLQSSREYRLENPFQKYCFEFMDRVHSSLSPQKVQSAFMIDLNQVSFALRNCTPKSLILLDEFGKGTVATGWSLP